MVRLHAPDILENKHAETLLVSKRSFQYFQPANGNGKPFTKPTDKQLQTLEAVFDDVFDQMKRSRNSKVFVFDRPDEVWMLVRHGDPCKREGALNSTGSSSVCYRPEVFDVIRYDRKTGELSINAGSCKKIYDLYREKIGLHFFDDALHFPAGKAKFTLDPLRAADSRQEIRGAISLEEIQQRHRELLAELEYKDDPRETSGVVRRRRLPGGPDEPEGGDQLQDENPPAAPLSDQPQELTGQLADGTKPPTVH